jgi:hypothetical protein
LKESFFTRSPFVFVSERGAPFSKRGFPAMVERAARAAGFDMKIHPHMLRHSCGYAFSFSVYGVRVGLYAVFRIAGGKKFTFVFSMRLAGRCRRDRASNVPHQNTLLRLSTKAGGVADGGLKADPLPRWLGKIGGVWE